MRPLSRTSALLVSALTLSLTGSLSLTAAATPSTPSTSSTSATAATSRQAEPAPARAAAARFPKLKVTRLVKGLDIPWDVRPLRAGRLLITERTTKRLLTWRKGKLRRVAYASSTVWAQGETGLMGLAIDPAFSKNRRFYTCQGGNTAGGGHDVRVMAWTLGRKVKRAFLVRPLLTGLPSTSGRHGGCRLLIAGGALYVGTGDAAVASNPRDLNSLGGKTLRLNRFTGAPWPTNPFIGSSSRNSRYVLTFGHRNVQGLAQRSDGSLWSVEQGSYRDDEVNKLVTGGDYGWNPGPGYDESVPMTDQSLPGTQIEAKWSSGNPTRATSGGDWVRGSRWGAYKGTLAVAALKDSRVLFLRFDYGWNPGPGYDESVPMTDQSLPGTQIEAKWSSGNPTRATSGGDWVRGSRWGAYKGTLAVAALKDSRVLFLRFDSAGRFQSMRIPPALTKYGRLRSVTPMPGGDLLVTTANGDGRDSILRVHPRR